MDWFHSRDTRHMTNKRDTGYSKMLLYTHVTKFIGRLTSECSGTTPTGHGPMADPTDFERGRQPAPLHLYHSAHHREQRAGVDRHCRHETLSGSQDNSPAPCIFTFFHKTRRFIVPCACRVSRSMKPALSRAVSRRYNASMEEY